MRPKLQNQEPKKVVQPRDMQCGQLYVIDYANDPPYFYLNGCLCIRHVNDVLFLNGENEWMSLDSCFNKFGMRLLLPGETIVIKE